MGFVRVVNMIPQNQSGETNQDSEPNLAVNPERPSDMVATAFTLNPKGGQFAPIFVSTDGGQTWNLVNVVPGGPGTGDITVGFATTGGVLYAGILNGQSKGRMQILRTSTFSGTTPMTVLVNQNSEDQPWVVAGSVVINGRSTDRVYVGSNDSQPRPFVSKAASVQVSQDAATSPAPAGFTEIVLGLRRGPFSLPSTRIALHPDGTVYAVFIHVTEFHGNGSDTKNQDIEVVVRRDDRGGAGANAFSDLVTPFQATPGVVAATGFVRFTDTVGQERVGDDLAIAVDPNNSSIVYIAWCDRSQPGATDWRMNVMRSTDRGQNWSFVRDIRPTCKNPALAINAESLVGLAYQEFTKNQWVTRLEVTSDAWTTPAEVKVLHQAPANVPVTTGPPYIGDYIRLLAVGKDFYGVFSGNNTPDLRNFPNSVSYLRNANFSTLLLLNTDGVTPVPVSIDPFFFHWSHVKLTESKPVMTKAELDTPPKNIKTEVKEISETKTAITKAELDTQPKTVKSEMKEVSETKHSVTKVELDLPPKGVTELLPQQNPAGGADALAALVLKLNTRLDGLEKQIAAGRAFIQPAERPNVGTPNDWEKQDE